MTITKTWTLRSALVAIIVGCLFLLEIDGAWGARQPKPNPQELWEAFPLDPQATTPDPRRSPVVPAEPAGPPVPPPVERDPGTEWNPLALGATGASLLLVVTAGLLLARRRRRGEAHEEIRPTTEELIARAHALAKDLAECDMLLADHPNEGAETVSEAVDRDLPVVQETPTTSSGSTGYAEIGERVAGVLSAAEMAADQIRADARLEAEEVLRAARESSEQMRRETQAYDSDTRAAVDSYATERRREAEQQVQKQLADADAQARATREAAEQMATQIEDDGRRRGQALREESRAVEERLKKALVGMRRMTVQLEELVGTPAGIPTDGESLADALKPYGQRVEERQPVVASQTEDEL